MDLAKAKGVIIALLLVFNIFLLYNNLSYFKDRSVQKETIENAVTILKSRGVALACTIPANSVKIHRLVYGNKTLEKDLIAGKLLGSPKTVPVTGKSVEVDGKTLLFSSDTAFVFTDSKPDSSVKINDAAEASKFARKYLENSDLLSGKYIVDSVDQNKDGSKTVRFIEKYDDYLVFDNYCMATLNNNGIIRLEYSKLQVLRFSPEKIENQISAYQVLLANYQKGSGQVITALDFGYKYPDDQSMEGMETSELLPVWRVEIKGAAEPDYLSTVYTADEADIDSTTN